MLQNIFISNAKFQISKASKVLDALTQPFFLYTYNIREYIHFLKVFFI